MNGYGPNQRPQYNYGGGAPGGGYHGFYDVTETQADTMINSINKPSTRHNNNPTTKLELLVRIFYLFF